MAAYVTFFRVSARLGDFSKEGLWGPPPRQRQRTVLDAKHKHPRPTYYGALVYTVNSMAHCIFVNSVITLSNRSYMIAQFGFVRNSCALTTHVNRNRVYDRINHRTSLAYRNVISPSVNTTRMASFRSSANCDR